MFCEMYYRSSITQSMFVVKFEVLYLLAKAFGLKPKKVFISYNTFVFFYKIRAILTKKSIYEYIV